MSQALLIPLVPMPPAPNLETLAPEGSAAPAPSQAGLGDTFQEAFRAAALLLEEARLDPPQAPAIRVKPGESSEAEIALPYADLPIDAAPEWDAAPLQQLPDLAETLETPESGDPVPDRSAASTREPEPPVENIELPSPRGVQLELGQQLAGSLPQADVRDSGAPERPGSAAEAAPGAPPVQLEVSPGPGQGETSLQQSTPREQVLAPELLNREADLPSQQGNEAAAPPRNATPQAPAAPTSAGVAEAPVEQPPAAPRGLPESELLGERSASSLPEAPESGRTSPGPASPPSQDLAHDGRESSTRPGPDPSQSHATTREFQDAPAPRPVEDVNSPSPQTTQEARPAREASPTRELRALPELPVRNETEIIREARMLARAGGGEARILLHPPQLGELSLRVTVTERAVTVSFVAEHAQIADLMARHLPELRQALQATGLRFDNLELDAHSATDNLDTFGQAADGEPRGYGAERQGGRQASIFPEGQAPLPSVSVNSLGTVDVTI